MKRKSIILALALVVAMTLPAVAEVEEITVGGDIQIRGSYLAPIGFDDDNIGLDWVTQRTRVNVDAKMSGGVRGFVELQSYDFWGADIDDLDLDLDVLNTVLPLAAPGPSHGVLAGQGNDNINLYQAYIEMNDIADYPLDLTMGRQELAYGREWLVGNNSAGINFSGQAFDAVKASYATDMIRVDAWWSKLVDLSSPLTGVLVGEEDADIDFNGVYATYTGIENMAIDGYFLWVRDAETTIGLLGTSTVPESNSVFNLYTVGGRLAGGMELGAGMLDYNVEAAFQFGDNNGLETGADGDFGGWALDLMAGYTFDEVNMTPRLEAEYAYFSGDDDLTDGDTDQFVRLFSDVHYGELNLGGNFDAQATNLHIIRVGASAVPVEKLTVKGNFYYFLLAEDDPLGGGVTFGLPQGVASPDDTPGYELDILADYQYTEDLNLRAGWAHFFADDAIKNSWGGGVSDDDEDYLYVQARLTF